ncbi:uncharacterized protein BJ171DRAFT_585685 [Polychytrium aggregatum]|uniref:uncharacterized protein n=1 Tax=Polychytrium aggregatum TaxID=110093 RepID=UPI0022FE03D3|nr:uncharacterized protein BJ171DRAFT_585685 [Polychytrium aggregatum]KAI9197362.1 hypothetical protein BJ171DRAFT_585685 [Polychytrium aggregatum]
MEKTQLMPQGRRMPEFKLQPSYAKQVAIPASDHGVYEAMMSCLGAAIGCLGSIPGCFICPKFVPVRINPFKVVDQGSVGLVSRFGKFYRSIDPGLYQINVFTETLQAVDIKIQIEDIPRQVVMTRDNVGVDIDSVLFWHISDPYAATFQVNDVRKALIERTQTTLRQIVGARVLQDCIENRETIAHEIQDIISEPAKAWGVKIESILIKDLQFSPDLLENLSAAAKQKRIGESKVIAAQAEVEAAKLMREASDILNTQSAMQIRYLETLVSMSKSSAQKVIFMPTVDESLALMEPKK